MLPAEIVALMNEYLSAMTDIIEEYGGFVDKYIGDAIVAVFGAPLDDPDQPANAGRARGAGLPGTPRRAQPKRDRLSGLQARPAHRAKFRRGAGRQHRLAPALQ